MKRTFLIHPFLFGIFPVLSLFLHNISEVPLSTIVIPTAIVIGFSILLLLLSRLIFKDWIKTALVATFFLLLFFSYGSLSQQVRLSLGDTAHKFFMPAICLILFYFVYIVKKTRISLLILTRILNFVSIFLFLYLSINIGVYKFKALPNWFNVDSTKKSPTSTPLSGKLGTPPDIYYVILDRYANDSILKEVFNFDNSKFINRLSSKGFYVASQSRSNYLKTAHSLSSSLNMRFINYLSEKVKGPRDNLLPIYAMLEDYKVWRFLKSRGYKFVHFGSWWPPTYKNKFADMNINLYWPPDFIKVLYRRTMLYPILKKLGYPHNFTQWKRIIYKFDKLAEIPNIKEPTFVFAHMLIPHPPYVFDQNGNFLSEEVVAKRNNKENYIDQLIFTNRKIEGLIDRLISNSEVPPIIILQGDEGPIPHRYRISRLNFNWEQASKAELRQKMGILNAYYLPHFDQNVLYASITPVNSFRLIFNHYFNTHFELLPDRSYAFVDERHPYKFFEVTGSVNFESLDAF